MSEPFFAIRVRHEVKDVDAVLAAVREAAARHDAFLQAASQAYVFDEAHAQSAYTHARRGFQNQTAAARDVGAEFLRFLACETQVGLAIQKAGVQAGHDGFVLVAAGAKAGAAVWRVLEVLEASRDPKGIQGDESVLEALGIDRTDRESKPQAQWTDLVQEKLALLDLGDR